MNLLLNSESDYTDFKRILKSKLEERPTRILENPGYKHAAVMILLMHIENEPHVLITKRTEKVKTHKGQMSLPGGGHDETDNDFLETAYRETFEEVGIHDETIEYIGQFDDYVSIFGFHISTFVGSVEYPVEYNFSEDEIDDHLEVPVSIFSKKKYDRVEYYNHEGTDYKIYHYDYKGYDIWGLTARILTDFGEEVLV